MIGLLVIQVLKAAGCAQVIAVDLDPARLDMAVELGASEGLRSDQPGVLDKIRQRTGGRGADAAFEVVGITPTLRLAVDSVRKGGQVTLVGNIAPAAELPLQAVVTREITLNGSCTSRGEYGVGLDMISRGVVKGASWFERLYAGNEGLLKVMLKP
jgi:L-iditol 2-dehydrogenase